jgi:hypothetical protein
VADPDDGDLVRRGVGTGTETRISPSGDILAMPSGGGRASLSCLSFPQSAGKLLHLRSLPCSRLKLLVREGEDSIELWPRRRARFVERRIVELTEKLGRGVREMPK